MKVIKCELCGNNQLVKQGDYFVCQFCGTKYAPEAAKKLIVDIASPVSIDGTVEVTKGEAEKTKFLNDLNTLLELDQRAEFRKKLEIAIRDYPGEWKVWFLSFKSHFLFSQNSYLRCMDGSTIRVLPYRIFFEKDVKRAKQVCPCDQVPNLERAYLEIYDNLIFEFQNSYIGYYESQQLLTTDYAFENKKWIDFIHKYAESCEKAAVTIKTELSEFKNKETLFISINNTQFSFSGKTIEEATFFDGRCFGRIVDQNNFFKTTTCFHENYSEEPDYYLTPNQFIELVKKRNSTSGCYIATCVYGSYDCPEVWRLRRFRDSVLSKTWRGRLFIRTYYAISPKLVKWFGETVWFKRIWKSVIDKIGLDLKNKGFDDTPYTDE